MPLEKQDTDVILGQLRQVGGRLIAEFRALIQAIPPEYQQVSSMARWLELDRSLCQRVSLGVRHEGDTVKVFSVLPGVRGLELFLASLGSKNLDRALVDSSRRALDLYRAAVGEHGGSQSKLASKIQALVISGANEHFRGSNRESRRHLYEGAKNLAGVFCDTSLGLFLFRPTVGKVDNVEQELCLGQLGLSRKPNGMNIAQIFGQEDGSRRNGPGSAQIDPSEIVEEFSTLPLPVVTSRSLRGKTVQIIDPASTQERINIVTSRFVSPAGLHPAMDTPPWQTFYLVSRVPARHLLLDVYLHRNLAFSSVPSASATILGTDGLSHGDPSERWFDQIPGQPKLTQLGEGLHGSHNEHCPRHLELTRNRFEKRGWNPDDYVGFRCEVEYPVWGVQYSLHFNFSQHDV